ncbi:hypothetical protein NLM31_08455 [Bradyrhizobium sp. CCGUVB4N]|uniref:hypothetical protein n=1 Tax=Bradyrhizobium sp. CCGUVB4N TaxID=2949631 RepID=UPI0020B3D47C|nr:hypothetical protein [Bradyrhizobium sp. CCGUVB4N]MCP3380400.1 hypothetical protein [Bradyrhizobium sp. CCGUVB4N]
MSDDLNLITAIDWDSLDLLLQRSEFLNDGVDLGRKACAFWTVFTGQPPGNFKGGQRA